MREGVVKATFTTGVNGSRSVQGEGTGEEGAEEPRGQGVRGVFRVPTEVSRSDGRNRVRGRC